MGSMTPGYVAWIYTLVMAAVIIGVVGLYLLLGHLITEMRLVRTARWQAKTQEMNLEIKKQDLLQERSRQAVAESQARRA